MAPISWRMSSAAIVSALIRDSANATSSFRFLHRNIHRVDLFRFSPYHQKNLPELLQWNLFNKMNLTELITFNIIQLKVSLTPLWYVTSSYMTTFKKPHLNCDFNFLVKRSHTCKRPRPFLQLPNWTFPLFFSSCKWPLRVFYKLSTLEVVMILIWSLPLFQQFDLCL